MPLSILNNNENFERRVIDIHLNIYQKQLLTLLIDIS